MKKFLIICGLLTVLAVAFIMIISNRRSEPWDEWVRRNVPPPAVEGDNPSVAVEGVTPEKETGLAPALEPALAPAWEKWVDKWVKRQEAEHKKWIMDLENIPPEDRAAWEKHVITDEDYRAKVLVKYREVVRAQYVAKAQELQKEYGEPSKGMEWKVNIEFEFPRVPPYVYEGPQTVSALRENFDGKYGSHGPAIAADEMDAKYPREEWLQLFIDKGYAILDHNDYREALNLRWSVEKARNNPEQWASGRLNIPPTDDWETYKEAFIDAEVSIFQRFNSATREDPEYTGGYIPESNPDVFLRYNGKRVYVMRNGLATSYYGKTLTPEQRRHLTHYGVHPEGIEVIYIDDDYNVLSDRPPLITPEMERGEVPSFITPDMLRHVELPPNDWKPPRGWHPPPGLEDALHANGWGGSFAPQEPVPPNAPIFPDNRGERSVPSEPFDPARHEGVSVTFDRLSGLSDAELSVEFEKLLRSTFPEQGRQPNKQESESAWREQFEVKRISSERLSRALDILDRQGPEKGLLRIREVDPEAAAQIERIFFRPSAGRSPPPRN